ncbi:MAG: DsbA family protein [Candidatus Eiseniibacteriota bacterium]
MRKFLSVGIVAVGVVLAAAVHGGPAAAAMADTAEALSDKVLGNKDAPVTIQAYESLTCPHCAAFEKETLPEIKKAYIDTGKVKLVYNDFPLDGRAMLASMVARCTGNARFFAMVQILFGTQETWAHASTPEAFLVALNQIARQGGLTDQEFTACTKNEALFNGIRERQENADKKLDVNSTPTFIIGDKRIVGSQPFAEFKKIIDPMLPKQ